MTDQIKRVAERWAAPRRKAPQPAPVRQAPTVESVVRRTLDEVIGQIHYGIGDKVASALTHVIIGPADDSFSDGTLAGDQGELGYSFTIRHPSLAVASGIFPIFVPDWQKEIASELQDAGLTAEPSEIAAIVGKIDFPKAIEAVLSSSEYVPDDLDRLPEHTRDAIVNGAEEKITQSISAYSREDPEVELPEYPAVYLKWSGSLAKIEYTVQGSGLNYRVTVKTRWNIKPKAWAYDYEARHNQWFRVSKTTSPRRP